MQIKYLLVTGVIALVAASHAAAQDRGRVPQGPQGTVTMPIGDYDRLVDRASQPERHPEPPPVPAVVGRAELRARVTGETARGTLRLEGEVFERGHVKVPLVSGATLLDARAEGRSLPLVQEGDAHVAVLAGPAPFAVMLEWAAPVTAAPGRAALVLPAPAAASISAVLELPGDPAEVKVEPGLITTRQTAGGRTTVEVTLEPGSRAQVSWSVRETTTAATPIESRILADVKSLVTIGEADLRMVALVDITVVQGEPRAFEVQLPAGFEVTAVTGSTFDTSEPRDHAISLSVRDPSVRRHQFLISLEQSHAPGSFKVDTSFPSVAGAQREVGETAIEGIGTIDVTASGDEGLRRMDIRETHASLRALARQPLLAAFRYQRRPEETHTLTLDVKRFADAAVIAAVAERASATTLVTTEGRALTEVVLWIRNRAQPFMKVTLPAGATMLSVEVAGEAAKPVLGSDGTRVPLLRTGFRPDGAYRVSFVYLNAGEAFAKRGDTALALPSFDVPVSILNWELFLPDQYSAKPIGGNVIPARLLPVPAGVVGGIVGGVAGGVAGSVGQTLTTRIVGRGEIMGRVTDPSGATVPGVVVTAVGVDGRRLQAVTDSEGVYSISGIPSGRVRVTGELSGFRAATRSLDFDQRPRMVDLRMEVGGMTETVEVHGDAPLIDTKSSEAKTTIQPNAAPVESPKAVADQAQQAPSQNVLNLQRRVAGVLPVRIDVPRSGTSYAFVRPLVLDEPTVVNFRYKKR
jgi:hypothetical protein